MTMLRLFGVTIVAGLIAGIASPRAQDANAAYIVSYIEVAPSSAADCGKLCCVRYAMRAARRQETAALKFSSATGGRSNSHPGSLERRQGAGEPRGCRRYGAVQ